MIYTFYIFDRSSECVYRRDWHQIQTSKRGEADDDVSKTIFGIVHLLRNFTRSLTNSDSFLNFSTSLYKLHYFETPANLKMVLITDPNAPSAAQALQRIYSTLYLEYVVKNPLSPINHSGGAGVDNELFNIGLDAFIQALPGYV